MACSHAADGPLFPKLKASLERWRVHYCDTEHEWMSCARYNNAAAGRPVPLALLPNGKFVQALDVQTARPSGTTSAPGAVAPTAWAATATAAPPAAAPPAIRAEPMPRVASIGHAPPLLPWWGRLFALLRGSR